MSHPYAEASDAWSVAHTLRQVDPWIVWTFLVGLAFEGLTKFILCGFALIMVMVQT